MEKEVVISFQNVSKTYRLYKNDKHRFLGFVLRSKRVPCKYFKALQDMTFEIRKGESVGIVGRNGAGKSTLLKLITGVSFADKGEIFVKGQVAALLELAAGFDPEMTGRENIYLKGYVLGLTTEQVQAMEPDVIEFAELDDFIDQPVRTYSSGMKARLGFAINVSVNPDILVIDEALSVGDALFSKKCQKKVSDIIASGVTVLFVSHSADKIRDFCTRGMLLEKGKLLAHGSVDEVIQKYDQLIKSQPGKKAPAKKPAEKKPSEPASEKAVSSK